MDFRVNTTAARLLFRSLLQGKAKVDTAPFSPQKTVACEEEEPALFQRTSPRRAGLSEAAVYELLSRLSETRGKVPHSAVLLVNGRCVAEVSSPGYSARLPHATFSMCKTVTGLAICMLVEDGRLSLEDKVASFFPELRVAPRMKGLTVRHLLCMQSGVSFGEAGAVVETDYARAFFESALRFEPGTAFSYNSMNSYMLAAIHRRVTGRTLTDFLGERLWRPLGMEAPLWETCPKGIEKGGWGMYLSTQGMARLGQLFLQKGVFNGRRIIGEDMIALATAAAAKVPEKVGHFDYGYQLWVERTGESYLFNGILGQNVWVYPKRGVVFAVTAEEPAVFQDAFALCAAMDILRREESWDKRRRFPLFSWRYFLLCRRFGRRVSWISLRKGEHHPYPFPLGEYSLPPSNASLLPLLLRLIQNNHTEGMRAVTLAAQKGGELAITSYEGEAAYTVVAKRHAYRYQTLSVQGEAYRVAAAYEVAADENRLPILKVELKFPELPFTRRLLFRLGEDGPTLALSETPGLSMISTVATSALVGILGETPFTEFLSEKKRTEFLFFRMEKNLSPVLPLSPSKAAQQKSAKEDNP